MMNSKRSSTLQLGNYLFAIPVIAALVLVFAISRAYQKAEPREENQLHFAQVLHPVPIDTIIQVEAEPEVTLEQDAGQPDEAPIAPPVSPEIRQPTTTITSQPAGGVTVMVTGIRSDSSRAAPLYVVDGVPMKGADFPNKIKPEDIARISVWKDESMATSLYGEAAENGVVVVTTKAAARTINAGIPEHVDTLTVTDSRSVPRHYDTLTTAAPAAQLGKTDFDGALIIIDGKESTAAVLRAFPTDKIKSIEVLKGEAAIKDYGTKGRNGVIAVLIKE